MVRPFIGTEGNGHTFPGASVPFGMVQFSPVSVSGGPGGYEYSQSRLTGFSLTRLSGAGCSNYGDIPLMPALRPPTASPAVDSTSVTATYSHANEEAAPGSYRVRLGSGISVALTATTRTGLGSFGFPTTVARGTVLIDASGSANARTASVRIVGRDRIVGSATSAAFGGACGRPPGVYTIYYALQFQRPFVAYGEWSGSRLVSGGRAQAGAHVGAWVAFDTRSGGPVLVKAAISFVSVAGALGNLAAEGSSWSIAVVQARARARWDALLGRIRVSGGPASARSVFYTALYHSLLQPNVFSDASGQYIGGDGRVHTAVGYTRYANFSGWDIYRGEMQLLSLLAPQQAGDMVHSLIASGAETGQLPKWPVANVETRLMVGDPSDAIIADAYAFGVRNFDAQLALQEMLAGAGMPQPGQAGSDAQNGYVERPALAAYLARGYIPGAASTTLEYAIADFAIAQLAAALGDQPDAATALGRSHNWKQLLNPFTGFIEPRLANGSFQAGYEPTSTTGFVEGDAWQYTWLVPQDMDGLLSAVGPSARRRLDSFFARLNAGPAGQHAWLGNEPSLLAPFAYLWLGAPSRAEDVIRRALQTLFTTQPAGLPGNDDLGALSSWYVWSALGLYPAIPGVAGLAIVNPLFSHETITLGTGGRLSVSASPRGRYIRSLTLDGQPYGSSWLPLAAIAHGGSLVFVRGATPSAWGTAPSSVPPSFPPGNP